MFKMLEVLFILALSSLTCFSEKVRFIATERPAVTYYDRNYIRYANVTSRRYSRADPFYYIGVYIDVLHEFHNNVMVHYYFYEFLSNSYRRGFVEMHFLLCDLIELDSIFGIALRQGRLAMKCPFPAGVYILSNVTIPLKNIPKNFPFTKGRIYCNITATATGKLIASGHIDMEIKEVHTNVRTWVDIKNEGKH